MEECKAILNLHSSSSFTFIIEHDDDFPLCRMPVQNIPLPLKYPKEFHQGIWGGEAVLMAFYKKSHYKRRFRKFWVPQLKKTVLYSEILNKYMRTIVTDRTLEMVHKHYGFDHYLLSVMY